MKIVKTDPITSIHRISSLPDNIIQGILSLIPTKYAVRTSLLSKRWRNLWTGILSLDFVFRPKRSESDCKILEFMDFVGNVLNHVDTTVLNKFRLSCTEPLDIDRVNAWISTAVGRRRVRQLILKLINDDCPIIIPVLYLNCECLTIESLYDGSYVLVCLSLSRTLSECELLEKSCVEFIPRYPASISFSKLKVLRLDYTEISFDQEFQQLSFSFPNLEEANLYNCIWVNVKTISFFVPRLKRLTLVNVDFERDEIRRDRNEDYCKINIYAESLLFLMLTIITSFEVSLYNLSSLNEASIHTWKWDNEDRTERCLSGILRAVTNVTDLTLCDATMDAIHSVSRTMNLLEFSNLKTLKIDVDRRILEGVILAEFFRYLPNIESLQFCGGLNDADFSSHIDEPNYGWKIERTPQPILLNLKLVEIGASVGHENEISMVEYLLLNARALEKISITLCSRKERFKFTNKLQLHLMEQGQDFTFSFMNTRAEFLIGSKRVCIE